MRMLLSRFLRTGLVATGYVASSSLAFAAHGHHAAPAGTSAWQVSLAGSGRQLASIRSTGPAQGIVLTCEGILPMLVLPAPRGTGPAKAMLELTAGETVAVPIFWNEQAKTWGALIGPREMPALALFEGTARSVSLVLSGVSLGEFPLAGSSAAMRTALAPCYIPETAPGN